MDGCVWMLDVGCWMLVIITPGCLRKGGGGKGRGGTVKAHDGETLEKKVVVKNYTTLAHTNGRQTHNTHTHTWSERHSTHKQKQTKTVCKCSLLYSSPQRECHKPVNP